MCKTIRFCCWMPLLFENGFPGLYSFVRLGMFTVRDVHCTDLDTVGFYRGLVFNAPAPYCSCPKPYSVRREGGSAALNGTLPKWPTQRDGYCCGGGRKSKEEHGRSRQATASYRVARRDGTAFSVGFGRAFHSVGGLSPLDDNPHPLGFADVVCCKYLGTLVCLLYQRCPMKNAKHVNRLTIVTRAKKCIQSRR